MLVRINIAWLLFICSFANAEINDVLARSHRSAFIPNLSLRYSFHDGRPQVFWAALTWEFDDWVYGDRVAVAIEIRRLEREKRLLENSMADNWISGE